MTTYNRLKPYIRPHVEIISLAGSPLAGESLVSLLIVQKWGKLRILPYIE